MASISHCDNLGVRTREVLSRIRRILKEKYQKKIIFLKKLKENSKLSLNFCKKNFLGCSSCCRGLRKGIFFLARFTKLIFCFHFFIVFILRIVVCPINFNRTFLIIHKKLKFNSHDYSEHERKIV